MNILELLFSQGFSSCDLHFLHNVTDWALCHIHDPYVLQTSQDVYTGVTYSTEHRKLCSSLQRKSSVVTTLRTVECTWMCGPPWQRRIVRWSRLCWRLRRWSCLIAPSLLKALLLNLIMSLRSGGLMTDVCWTDSLRTPVQMNTVLSAHPASPLKLSWPLK